jgi:hypothetical protein
MTLIASCTFLTAQNTEARLDPVTGNLIAPFEKAQLWANIIVQRDSLLNQVKSLERKLAAARSSMDDLEAINFQLVADQLAYVRRDRERDIEISDIALEERNIWRSLSRGLSLTTALNTQVYNFVEGTATSPVSISSRLAITGDRWSMAVIPFGAALSFPTGDLQVIGGVKLSLGYKWF